MESTKRVAILLNHIIPDLSNQSIEFSNVNGKFNKSPKDIVIVDACRTPVCKAGRGGLKDTSALDLLTTVLKAILDRTKIDAKLVDDICVGTVLPLGSVRADECRMAAYLAGYGDSTNVYTVNRQCSSSLQAIANVAASINAGHYEIGVAAGVESMSMDAFRWDGAKDPKVMANKNAKNCLIPMGLTSENVAAKYNISRADQDALAVSSHQKAGRAIAEGRFKNEIIPVKTIARDAQSGQPKEVIISVDDGVRANTTIESLTKLKAAFSKTGSTTAGNASQVSDGAAATLLMKRETAQRLGLKILGSLRSFAVAGVPPEIMGVGPAFAIPLALKKAGVTINDIDIFEINEAFASQALYCVQKLGVPAEKLNPNGGGIAIGHPLGATGARMTATLFNELKRTGKKLGIVSMCIGSGMGAAAVFEAEY